eukprot:2337773-Pyramimonas_sp.AAC.1
MVDQSPGILLSEILRQAFSTAFPTWDAVDRPPLGEDDTDDHRRYIKSKVFRSQKALGDARRCLRTVAMAFMLHPLQWVFARLQHLDAAKGCLLDVVGSESPFKAVQEGF